MALNSITSAENSSMPTTSSVVNIVLPASAAEFASSSFKPESFKKATVEPVDTVTLQNKTQNTKQESQTEKVVKEEGKKSDLTRSIGDVLFDYNSKGDLRIKFMDSGNKLVYQTPPALFAKITDLISQSQSSVNTKA